MLALDAARFRPLLQTRFRAPHAPHTPNAPNTIELELVEVAESETAFVPGGRAAFSLFFVGPAQPILPQAIHHLEHAALEPLDLFLVPIGRDAKTGAIRYEAVFT